MCFPTDEAGAQAESAAEDVNQPIANEQPSFLNDFVNETNVATGGSEVAFSTKNLTDVGGIKLVMSSDDDKDLFAGEEKMCGLLPKVSPQDRASERHGLRRELARAAASSGPTA